MWMNRRAALAATAAFAAAPAFASPPPDWAPILEKKFGGRLGVAVLDTANGRRYVHRGDERFRMCSMFKVLAASAILTRADAGKENLDRPIAYGKSDLLAYARVTTAHVAEGHMTLVELCAAAVSYSDNTAANLVLAQLGGPPGVTQYARSIGDTVTHLDRTEPALNTADGDRDTTTPRAMLADIHKLVLGDALSAHSREKLQQWLLASHNGERRIRAGVPSDWRVGDKPGTSLDGVANDLAVLWPPQGRAPIVVAAFYVNPGASWDARENVLMEVGRAIAANFG